MVYHMEFVRFLGFCSIAQDSLYERRFSSAVPLSVSEAGIGNEGCSCENECTVEASKCL